MKNNNHGFAILEALLILVIISLLGFTGWYVYHSKRQANNSYTSSSLATQSSLPKSKQQPTTTQTAQSQHYLTIKEWGVKVTLSSGILDAVTATNSFDPGFYFLSTKSLQGTGCSTDDTAGGGFYLRFKSGQYNSEVKELYSTEYPDAIKLGQYYYAYGRNPAAEECDNNIKVQQKANSAAKEFKSALKTIQLVS